QATNLLRIGTPGPAMGQPPPSESPSSDVAGRLAGSTAAAPTPPARATDARVDEAYARRGIPRSVTERMGGVRSGDPRYVDDAGHRRPTLLWPILAAIGALVLLGVLLSRSARVEGTPRGTATKPPAVTDDVREDGERVEPSASSRPTDLGR